MSEPEKTEEEKVEEAARVAEALLGFTTCAFCGAEFRKDRDGDKIKHHIYECVKHPIAGVYQKLVEAREIIDKYDKEMTEIRVFLTKEGVPEVEENENHRRMLTQLERVKILADRLDAKRPDIPKRVGP